MKFRKYAFNETPKIEILFVEFVWRCEINWKNIDIQLMLLAQYVQNFQLYLMLYTVLLICMRDENQYISFMICWKYKIIYLFFTILRK